ncbi:MAG: hypothetical protein BECKG1743D_GA0114223_108933 [Candidatus Kentron sp. G]|nr:MAG: hypothetical protein BECKG1743D_GA0114223_108933 [Candidatus Kentron sp. G]
MSHIRLIRKACQSISDKIHWFRLVRVESKNVYIQHSRSPVSRYWNPDAAVCLSRCNVTVFRPGL